jgi:Divergent InlB B-repeat domain
VHRNLLRAASIALVFIAVFASRASAQTTALYLESQTGDYIGAGFTRTYTAADAPFTTSSDAAGVHVNVVAAGYAFWWSLNFAVPSGGTIGAGTYTDALRFPTAAQPGLDVYGDGRGCNAVTGRFVIREYVAGAGGSVARFAADFEQHCEDASAGLFGAIRYNSTISSISPFDGAYPDYRLTIVPSANGTVMANGLTCSLTSTPCSRTYVAPTDVVLTAMPDAGYAFAGWSGACASVPQQSAIHVNVNQPKRCQATFSPGPAQITALYLQSQSGDWVGAGQTHTYGVADGTFNATVSSYSNGVQIHLYAPDYAFWWYLNFSPLTGATFAPGPYGDATQFPTMVTPGLDVSGLGHGCNRVTGRFVVREYVAGAGGTMQRFAADFEQHCEDADAALFGAIRYNSTITSLVPFDGAYPDYRLTITPTAHGTVTGAGFDCGVNSLCSQTYASPAAVSLTATPDDDSVFLGWSGSCTGLAQTTVHVNGPKQCQARFAQTSDVSPWTVLTIDSQPGDSVGAGQRWLYGAGDAAWTLSWIGTNHHGVTVRVMDGTTEWRLDFVAPASDALAAGTYLNVVGNSSGGRRATVNVTHGGLACTTVTGRFVVRELTVAGDGSIAAAAIDFEQHCNDADAGLFGALRYNSSLRSITPFDGAYPDYRVTIARPAHGAVTGTGIDCSASQDTCARTFLSPTTLMLSAAPDPGYMFVGWTGSCTGSSPVTLHVNQPLACEALFDSTTTPAPRTALFLDSQPGDYMGQGRQALFNGDNSTWTVAPVSSGRNGVRVTVSDVTSWTLQFAAPTGATLAPGTYSGANSSYSGPAPYLSVLGESRYCDTSGWFIVRELALAPDGSVLRLAIDFEQHCAANDPALFGALRYNSTVASFTPFDGQYPDYRLTITAPLHGTVTGDGVNCGGGQTACERTVGVPTSVSLLARPDAGYMFGGWSGDCAGGPTMTIKINGRKQCAAAFVAITSTTARSIAMVGTQKGDYIGNGQAVVFTTANAGWSVSSYNSTVRITVNAAPLWNFTFDAPTGGRLGPGTFIDTRGYADASSAGLDISGNYHSCTSIGRFIVRELTVSASGTLVSFAADFEQHCQNSKPGLRGIIRYNSTVDLTNMIPPLAPVGVKIQ